MDRIYASLAMITLLLLLSVAGNSIPIEPQNKDSSQSEASIGALLANDYESYSKGDFSQANFSRLNLTVSLDEAAASANGTLLIDFYNEESISFDRIPFHLYLSGMSYETRQGEIVINNVVSTGDSPEVSDVDVFSGQQLMWVEFASPVLPGEFVSLNITFESILPDGYDRAGAQGTDVGQDRIYTFTGFFPIPCVYDIFDGWNTDPYAYGGDPFYFDMAFYDLLVEVPEGMVVAATGELADQTTEGGRVQYHYNISIPVREVTFSASRFYMIESTIFNGVNVSTYFLPVSASVWEDDSLEQAVQALELFNSTFGIYPYPTLNIVEQHAYYGGMEYPCQVYATRVISEQIQAGTRVSWYLELVIVHEVAHQWWSQIVGDDCVDWGFLDEGLTSWSHSYFGEYYYSDWEHFQSVTYLDSVRLFHAEYGAISIINQSNTVRPEDLTSFVDYVQMPLILEKLRLTIGHDAFIDSLSLFCESNYFGIATLNDLQIAFESVLNSDLDWFFFPWFANGRLPNYAITNAIFDTSDSSLTFDIIDLNEPVNEHVYSQQIPIRISDTLGSILVDTIEWVNGTTTLQYELEGTPAQIVLDYSGYILVELPDESTVSYSFTSFQVIYNIDWVFVGVTAVVLVVVPTAAWRLRRERIQSQKIKQV
ncbi:MAG: M1 family metallopeptidase [Candidatus Thorarchaeota archaeon]